MRDVLLGVVGLVLAGALAVDTALLVRVDRRLSALESQLSAAPSPRRPVEREAVAELLARRPVAEERPAGPAAEGKEPPAEGKWQEKIGKLEERWREAAASEVEAFALEFSLDPDLTNAVLDEVIATSDATSVVREDIRQQRVTLPEGKAEIRELRDASDARLDELLGSERAEALAQRLRDTRPF